jgi:hypothetical protein
VLRVSLLGGGVRVGPVAVGEVGVEAIAATLGGAVGAGVNVGAAEILVARRARTGGRSITNRTESRRVERWTNSRGIRLRGCTTIVQRNRLKTEFHRIF